MSPCSVHVMVCPVGVLQWRGVLAGACSSTGALESRTWLVAPESTMASSFLMGVYLGFVVLTKMFNLLW